MKKLLLGLVAVSSLLGVSPSPASAGTPSSCSVYADWSIEKGWAICWNGNGGGWRVVDYCRTPRGTVAIRKGLWVSGSGNRSTKYCGSGEQLYKVTIEKVNVIVG